MKQHLIYCTIIRIVFEIPIDLFAKLLCSNSFNFKRNTNEKNCNKMRIGLTLIAFFSLVQMHTVLSQGEVSYGLTLRHGLSSVSNKQKMITDQVSGAISVPVRSYPVGLWQTSSLAMDSYWLDKRIIASIGLNFFHFKSVSDSVKAPYSQISHYGRRTNSTSIVLPFIRLAYRFSLGEHLIYQPSISIGATEIFNRNKLIGVAYDPAGQESWANNNQNYKGFNWSFYLDKRSFIFEFSNNIVYDLKHWSFSGGLSYFFYRNLPIEGYHGLHLNVGCSVRFGD